jgi:hypothetical protein
MKLFKFKKKKEIEEKSLYVVNKGTFGGEYLVLIKRELPNLTFLVLPDLQSRVIEEDVFKRGLEISVVKFIEVLPNYVFNTCKSQFDKINNTEYEQLCKTDKNNQPN